MASTTTKQTFNAVTVLAWEFSHCTTNGIGVYNFTIKTIGDVVISGKTQGGIHQSITREPKRLTNVTISTSRTGRVRMIDASN